MIEGAVARGLDEIGAGRLMQHDLLAAPPELEHHVLNDFFGGSSVVKQRVGDAHEGRVPLAEERIERPLISLPEPLKEGTVVHEFGRNLES